MRSSCFQDVSALRYAVSSYLPATVICPLPTVMLDLPTTQQWSTQWHPGASITVTASNRNYELKSQVLIHVWRSNLKFLREEKSIFFI